MITLNLVHNTILEELRCGNQYDANKKPQTLILTIAETMLERWETAWKAVNDGVVLDDGSIDIISLKSAWVKLDYFLISFIFLPISSL